MKRETLKVKFHTTNIWCVIVDDVPFVAIKPICEHIGLHADSALNSIKNDEIFGPEHVVHSVQVGEKQSRDMLCLPIEQVHGWLCSIQVSKVKPEIRPLLVEFKKECYKVLYDHFYGKNKQINENIKQRFELDKEFQQNKLAIADLEKKNKEIKSEIARIDNANFNQLNLFNI